MSPIDPARLALTLGATFVARSFSGDKRQLVPILKAGLSHKGLALVDDSTVAIINDSDFGLRTILVDADGKEVSGDATKCEVNRTGAITNAGSSTDCPAGVVGVRVARGNEIDRHTRIWLFKFSKTLTSYTVSAAL